MRAPFFIGFITLFLYSWTYLIIAACIGIIYLIYKAKTEPLKSVFISNTPLYHESATRLAQRIKNKEITSVELVEAFIKQIQQANPLINALVVDRFEVARLEAKRADMKTQSVAPEDLPPLHGVPCTIKECFSVKGLPLTSGLMHRLNMISSTNATAVQRYVDAGAIIIGTTNISELCMWMESNNKVYGRTKNPYDTRRIVGGSSGGEAAILAASGAAFGLGSDIGGSVRMPAFFCGIFAHKPSGGLIPNTGQFPYAQNGAVRYLTTGPMCKKAEDLWPLLKILAGPDDIDTGCVHSELKDPSTVKLKELSFYSIRNGPGGIISRVHHDLKNAQSNVESFLKKQGCALEVIEHFAGFKKSLEIWSSSIVAAGGDPYAFLMGNQQRSVNLGLEIIKYLLDYSVHTLPSIGCGISDNISRRFPKRAEMFLNQGKELKKQLLEKLGNNGVILYPSYPTPAPKHNQPLLPPFNWVHTAIFNILEFSVTQVPLGLNSEGIPLGIQVASIPGNDHVTIAVALELEKAFGGWVPPKGSR
eukprot:TRINITY_DN1364_c0_g2_i1.p1 TRINITY_DN1364_c0_g2~~TRINITY_DN1364_c0_g2_i1.p1  ORF type:complete len:532 (+),score=70.19 TRINITY_DN1364_c0_g2_i1:101-1696(+)